MRTKLKSTGQGTAGVPGKTSRSGLALGVLMLAGLLFQAGEAQAAVAPLSGEHRLFLMFIEDGAIIRKGWLEFSTGYQDYADGRDLDATFTAAFRFGRDVEAGVVAGFLDRRRASGARLFGPPIVQSVDSSGLSDARIFGKYRIVRRPFDLAVGAVVQIPLANDDAGLGSGTFDYRAFVGLRKGFSRATLVWSIGVGKRGDSGFASRAEGQSSLDSGAGVLIPLSHLWTLVIEAQYESARFRGEQADGRALVGLDWRPTDGLVMRGGAGFGWTDGAPDLSALLSIVFHFW